MSDMTQRLEPPRSPEIMDSLIASPCPMALEESLAQTHHHPHAFVLAPSRVLAEEAAKMISEIIWPHQKGGSHKHSIWDNLTRMRLEQMLQLFQVYSSESNLMKDLGWIHTSKMVVISWDCGLSYASKLREWCQAFMADFNMIPRNPYGKWKESILMDEDIRQDIEAHLHSLGPFISAMDIVEFLNTPDMHEHLGCDKLISLWTGQHWLKMMGYCWKREKKGQYSDGHEQEDVVKYWQHVFLPAMAKYGETTRKWNEGVGK